MVMFPQLLQQVFSILPSSLMDVKNKMKESDINIRLG